MAYPITYTIEMPPNVPNLTLTKSQVQTLYETCALILAMPDEDPKPTFIVPKKVPSPKRNNS
jgi:hypothetical protein